MSFKVTRVGKNFKITVTSDHDVRVKVPVEASEKDEAQWIQNCRDIQNYLTYEDIQFTLRGQTLDANEEYLKLKSKHSGNHLVTRYGFNFELDTCVKAKVEDIYLLNKKTTQKLKEIDEKND